MHRASPFCLGRRQRNVDRLESHAAFWARPGSELADFRVHWTGVLDVFQARADNRFLRVQVFLWLGFETRYAGRAAKVITVPCVLDDTRGFVGIYMHAANRIAMILFSGCLQRWMDKSRRISLELLKAGRTAGSLVSFATVITRSGGIRLDRPSSRTPDQYGRLMQQERSLDL